MSPERRLAAGAATLLLCGQYLAAEAITAAAWPRPYSYSRNYISDLGVSPCSATGICSPLAAVMNGGFVLAGLLALVSAFLLRSTLRPRLRWAVLALTTVHAVGSITVGLVHSAPGTLAGTPHLHVMGAYAAILGGNLALMGAGLSVRSDLAGPAFRGLSVACGAFGLGCGLALVLSRGWPPGLLERGAVDTITLWEMAAGLALLGRIKRLPT
ncbi:DUF998 domain-containing protein [Lichenihabitans sp. Uapishka_5]|uniref:DUF998 domain-containing protein n=1 Tax=Lichenihabitans sp. Uapishka_5 TaxID=3037302 RepID=UPI0029E7DF9F|nr:DUF998 domain-containing protein [Lichenihabitans sp. Uapishka_5]MDX7951155.1 DUF998 domain-containing protein [Lichenihabitans sp. Uapishka_5]